METPDDLPVGAVSVENGQFVWETLESKNVAKSFSFMLEARFGHQGQGSPKKQSDKQENIEELNKNRQGTELNLMQAEEKNETIVLQDINLKVSFLLFNAPLDKSWRVVCNRGNRWIWKNKPSKRNNW